MNAKLNYLATLIALGLIKSEARRQIAEAEGKLLAFLKSFGCHRLTYKLEGIDAYSTKDSIRLPREAQTNVILRLSLLLRCTVWTLKANCKSLPLLPIAIDPTAIDIVQERGYPESHLIHDSQAVSAELLHGPTLTSLEKFASTFVLN